MYFDDGSNPWQDVEQTVYEFDFLNSAGTNSFLVGPNVFTVLIVSLVLSKVVYSLV